jgi:hypothetical protein
MEIPPSFVDHVFSMEVMRDPVSTPGGHTFEREDITQWILVSRTHPVTRAPLALWTSRRTVRSKAPSTISC